MTDTATPRTDLQGTVASRKYVLDGGGRVYPEVCLRIERDLPQCPGKMIEIDDAGNVTEAWCLIEQTDKFCTYERC